MSTPRKPEVRGACPGALRPMESGDGLIVRVRPHAGVLALDQAKAVAKAAAQFGNGEIDLTQRANLQLRGVRPESLDDLHRVLADASLLDASPEAEAIRNIVVSPFAHDALEGANLGPRRVARALDALLPLNSDLFALSPKFGFLVDDAAAHLDGVSGDIVLRHLGGQDYALGCAGPEGVRWLGRVDDEAAAVAAIEAARVFLVLAAPASRLRLKAAPDAMVAALRDKLALDPLSGRETPPHVQSSRLGAIHGLVGVGLPFGRMSSAEFIGIIDVAESFNARHLRLSPWRAIYVECAAPEAAEAAVEIFTQRGFVMHDNDPLAAIDACPGAPACPCAYGETRAAARQVAALFAKLGLRSAHISGCAKGCARGAKADLVLVGEENGFGVVRHGTAADRPKAHIDAALGGLMEALNG